MARPVLQEHVDGSWRTIGHCGDALPENRCAGCTAAGGPHHVEGLRNRARALAGLLPGVLVNLPGGPRPTRVVDSDGSVVVEHRPLHVKPECSTAALDTASRGLLSPMRQKVLDCLIEGQTLTMPADAPPFDTQQVAAEVRKAGQFNQQQADAIVRASVHATANLVTRTDLDNALERQTEALRGELKSLSIEMHKAVNAQTWRYIMFTGAMLGLLRWLFPTS